MNAYDLADELNGCDDGDSPLKDMAVTMLRQQAKRIEELEGRKGWFEVNKDGYVNHKPIAWMSPDGKVSTTEGKLFYKPLYLHPYKELSDDEIDNCAYETGMWCDGTPDEWDTEAIHNFARAIIKASRGEE